LTKASEWEFRLRGLVLLAILLLGFWAPWSAALGWTHTTTWLVLASWMYKSGWLTFTAASDAVLVTAIVLLALGAWLRVWGAAYVGASVVKSHQMHGDALQADGPYRRMRNPLYLGLMLHIAGLAILMPPSGAVFAIALCALELVRLTVIEEPFLQSRLGETYSAYKAKVPRFLPAPTPQVAAAGARPRWAQAVLGEIYVIGVVIVFAVFGWNFNAMMLVRGVLISAGLSLVVRAMLPKMPETA
jgi:protein-S-isoprenylcysteine O-methyltransferase Ste14